MSKSKQNNKPFENIALRAQKTLSQEKGVKGLFIVIAGNGKASVSISYPKDSIPSQAALMMGVEEGLKILSQKAADECEKLKQQDKKQKSQDKLSDESVDELIKKALLKILSE